MRLGRTKAITYLKALVAALLLVALTGWTSSARAQSVTLDHGHIDAFYVTADGGGLNLALKEDVSAPGTVHAPEDVAIEVSDSAFTDATEKTDLGVPTYFLPQAQKEGLPWPGWDTNEVVPDFESIDIVLDSVSGPGTIYLFETETFGGLTPIVEDGGLDLHDGAIIPVPSPTHRHANWAFTEPGTYQISAYATGDGVSSNVATYTFLVGSGAEFPAMGGGGASGGGSAPEGTVVSRSAGQGGQSDSKTAAKTGAKPESKQPAKPSGQANANAAPNGGKLAETGSTPGTIPWFVAGFGLLAFGGGVVALSVAERRRV